ncbi:hypothetical protein QTH91_01695 [Variovorax dokdonensis]|uniref:Transmembrane protein n=2 Tax=Variovorax dokdonensis TaxID=344883 RepID=A0ABT7N5F5_9BURK|nr:hypothetical protein [Variovorax dokdonensis]MDM0043184.1 hypothetical protein [Variovorax dokdonensis]
MADEPLGLTVHSMPSPQQTLAAAEDGKRTRLGRMKMLLVMLVCAAPVIASYFTYYVVRPEGRSAYGELIDPQRPLPDVAAAAPDGSVVKLPTLRGQWLLVVTSGGECDSACEQALYLQRQLREGLGREKDRLDRVWLISDGRSMPERLRAAMQGATVLQVPQAQLAQWLQAAPGHALADHMYLVDPMGNWMMRFPPNMDAAGASRAKRDIERVLRASSSWDEAGR